LPWPREFKAASTPLELIVAGAQFQKVAAGFDNPLTADFARAADVLFDTGFKRLAEA
jgi:hypothetical protein